MNPNIHKVLSRLRNPTVILSIVSNLISLGLLLGYKLNEGLIMSAVTIICSILITLGILSNPDKTDADDETQIDTKDRQE